MVQSVMGLPKMPCYTCILEDFSSANHPLQHALYPAILDDKGYLLPAVLNLPRLHHFC